MSRITPCLWFDRNAEEAARLYTSLLPDSRIDHVTAYSVETPSGKPGETMLVEFTLAGQSYMALNGGPLFKPNEAVSFSVSCEDQAEVDRLWDALTANGGAPQQCGWLKDRYGFSWQIVPKALTVMMKDKDPEKVRRVMEAVMAMVKLDLPKLKRAFDG